MKLIVDSNEIYDLMKESDAKVNDLNEKFNIIADCNELSYNEKTDMLIDIIKDIRFQSGYNHALVEILNKYMYD